MEIYLQGITVAVSIVSLCVTVFLAMKVNKLNKQMSERQIAVDVLVKNKVHWLDELRQKAQMLYETFIDVGVIVDEADKFDMSMVAKCNKALSEFNFLVYVYGFEVEKVSEYYELAKAYIVKCYDFDDEFDFQYYGNIIDTASVVISAALNQEWIRVQRIVINPSSMNVDDISNDISQEMNDAIEQLNSDVRTHALVQNLKINKE